MIGETRRALAALAVAGLLALAVPASAGEGPGSCCICEGCASPPATQCFVLSAEQCELQCATLDCGEFISTEIACSSQPPCQPFEPPAPAPALAPLGLGLAAVVLSGFGWRAMRRRR